MATQSQLRDEINKQLLEALKSNTIVPWQQPWTDASCVMPASILTKLPYRDINPILLRIAAKKHGYTSRWWGTERQWTVMGGKLKSGAKSVRVFENTGGPDVIGVVVYNMDCVEGGRFGKLRDKPDVSLLAEATDDEGNPRWRMEIGRGLVNIEAERIIKATGADFREEPRNGALYYRPPLDYIVVPQMSQFYYGPGGPASYYATAYHEIAHWTETRLNWYADPTLSVKKRYALGELRSDICSAYLCAACGIPPQKDEINFDRRTNFARYVKHWVSMMEEDNSVIFDIARAASEAADFVLSFAERAKIEGRKQNTSKSQDSPTQVSSGSGTIEEHSEIIPDDLDLALDDVPKVLPVNDVDSDTEFALDDEPDVEATSEPESKIIPLDNSDVQPSSEQDFETDFALDEEPGIQPTSGPTSDIVALDNVQATSKPDSEIDFDDLQFDEVAEDGAGVTPSEEQPPNPEPVNCAACGQPLLLSGQGPWNCCYCAAQFGNFNCPFCKTSQYRTITGGYFQWNCVHCQQLIYVGEPPPPPKEHLNKKRRSDKTTEVDDVPKVVPVANETPHPEIRHQDGSPYYSDDRPPRNIVWCPDCGKGTQVADVRAPWACAWCDARFQWDDADKEHLPLAPRKKRKPKRKGKPIAESTPCPNCGQPLPLSGQGPWQCVHCAAGFGTFHCPFCKTWQYKTITGEYFEWNCVHCHKLIHFGEPPATICGTIAKVGAVGLALLGVVLGGLSECEGKSPFSEEAIWKRCRFCDKKMNRIEWCCPHCGGDQANPWIR